MPTAISITRGFFHIARPPALGGRDLAVIHALLIGGLAAQLLFSRERPVAFRRLLPRHWQIREIGGFALASPEAFRDLLNLS